MQTNGTAICYPQGKSFPSPGPRVDCWAFSQQPARGQGLPICREPSPASAEGNVPKKFRQNGCFGGAKRSERGLGESLLKRFPQEAGTGLRPLAQGCAGAGKIVFPPRHACGEPWREACFQVGTAGGTNVTGTKRQQKYLARFPAICGDRKERVHILFTHSRYTNNQPGCAARLPAFAGKERRQEKGIWNHGPRPVNGRPAL